MRLLSGSRWNKKLKNRNMNDRVRWIALVCFFLCHVLMGWAQQPDCDSVCTKPDRFQLKQLIIPSALITVGSFGVENGWFNSVNHDVKDGFEDLRKDKRFRIDDYLQYLPVTANVTLAFLGAKSKHSFRERVAATATAYAAMGLMVNVTKVSVKERRPGSGARNSFPSGHTATAFMGAELVREEYGMGYGLGAYAVATSIAFLRMYNNRHWLNDVIGGAGVGILSARIGYWLLPWESRLFGWDKKKTAISVTPSYQPEDKSLGMAVFVQF